MSAVLQFLGRTHPLVLHLPIGFVFAALALELVAWRTRSPLPASVRATLAWLTAASAAATATTGWLLAASDSYPAATVDTHRWLGVAVAVVALARALTLGVAPRGSRVLLVIAALLIVPAGHLGGTITHGAGFLTAPFTRELRATGGASANEYASRIAPLFESRCTSCHGTTKQKGDLALHDPVAIARGGSSGPILVPGSPQASELVRRLRLPASDEEHMPPEGKPQLSAEEMAAVEAWIAAGARFSADG